MAFESVRSYVQLASGLGEMTMAKAMEAAQGLLALPGADEVTRKVVQASTLAEELLDVARSNRANLVALVQGEVESALKRADVVRVADLDAARTALAGVSKELADLKALVVTTGASAVAGASRGSLGRSGAVSTTTRPASSTAAPAGRPPRTAKAAKAPATKAAPRKAAVARTAKKATATGAAAKKTTAKKATAKKTTATKATAKKSTVTKATATKAPAKKATATKSTATKVATRKATS